MEQSDYSSFMALPRTASRSEVRAAYRRLAMRFHPDMNTTAEAAVRFGYLCEAYRCLSDPDAREAYDRELAAGSDPAISVEVAAADDEPDAADDPASDPVSDPAVRPAPGAWRKPRPGLTRYVVLRTPRHVPRNRLRVSFQRRDPCRRCGGLGLRKDDDPAENWSACHACWGTGHVFARRTLTILYRSRRVLGGELIVPHEGDAGDFGGPRGSLILNIITPEHTARGLLLPALVGALLIYCLFFSILFGLGGCDNHL